MTFLESDYRDVEGRFDRVVSVGMMEHVGVNYFDAYFAKVRDMLTDDGFAMIHAIGRVSPPGTTGPFIRKYIFPGGYVPALSEVFASLERVGLWTADTEILRLHYYYTIRHWRLRFAANREAAARLYDERFCRMWEFYLSAVELGFLHGSNMVFQLLLSRQRDAVPIVRDYIVDDERAMTAPRRQGGPAGGGIETGRRARADIRIGRTGPVAAARYASSSSPRARPAKGLRLRRPTATANRPETRQWTKSLENRRSAWA